MAGLPRRLGHAEEATLGEHLEELRGRLFVMLGAIALASVVAFVFNDHVLNWLDRPLPPDHHRLLTTGVAEPFTVTIMVSIYAGFVVALPIVLWQLWLFFAPAVDPAAERKVLGLAVFSLVLAAGGVAFGYWVLLPRAVHFLTNYDNAHFQHLVQARPYYNFIVTVLVGIVLVFQTPLVVLGLVYLRVLSSGTLRRQRRMGYLVTAAIALALAAAGVAFGYWVLLPRAVHFLVNYDPQHFLILPRASSYYNFVVTVLVGIVLVFQTPLVVVGLVWLGVMSSHTLRRHRRMGYLVTAAIALALPGPDPVTTFLELLPMWLLFEGSIWLAVLVERRKPKVAPASATLGG